MTDENAEDRKGQTDDARKLWMLLEPYAKFSDQNDDAYIAQGAIATPIASKAFRELCTGLLYERQRTMPSKDAIGKVEQLCTYFARKERIELGVRMQENDGAVHFDPLDGYGIIYRISDKDVDGNLLAGMEVHCCTPRRPVTVRWPGMLPAVVSVEGGIREDLNALLGLWALDDENRILLKGYIGAMFKPGIGHAILEILGGHGSGKSWLTDTLRSIVDPTSASRISIPSNKTDILTRAKHTYVLTYDNVNEELRPEITNILSILCTGGGISSRRLYTDTEESVISLRRIIILNGINVVAYALDFLDRVLSIHLLPIEKERRLSEERMTREVNALLPKVRCYCLNLIPAASMLYPQVVAEFESRQLPRMADFALWGETFCRVMEESPGSFMAAFVQKQESETEEALQESTLLNSLLTFTQANQDWKGTVGALYAELRYIVVPEGSDQKNVPKDFPKDPARLGRALRDMQQSLPLYSVKFEELGRGKQRLIRLRMTSENISPLPSSSKVKEKNTVGTVEDIEHFINPTRGNGIDSKSKVTVDSPSVLSTGDSDLDSKSTAEPLHKNEHSVQGSDGVDSTDSNSGKLSRTRLSLQQLKHLFATHGVQHSVLGDGKVSTIPTYILEKSNPDLVEQLRAGGWRDQEKQDRSGSYWTQEA